MTVLLLIAALLPIATGESILDSWWTYDPFSLVENWKQGEKWDPDWRICGDGKRQSPINIDTDKLVYTPSLRPVNFTFNKLTSATVRNTGQNVMISMEDASSAPTISNGPLSYTYQISKAVIKFGSTEDGSEHKINNQSFPGELQFFGFNNELYESWDEAQNQPNGLIAFSIFIMLYNGESSQLGVLMKEVNKTQYKDEYVRLESFDFSPLIPLSDQYLTYEGSLSFPACYETVTWIILNAPIFATANDVEIFRRASRLRRGDERKLSLANNFRSIKSLNGRTVLTNINFQNAQESNSCDVRNDIRYSLSTF